VHSYQTKNGHETPPEVTDSWKTAIHKQSVTQRKEMLLIQSLLVSLHLLPKRQETLAFVQQRRCLAKTTTPFSGVFVDSFCIKRKQLTLLRMAAVIIQYGCTRKRQCNDRSVVVSFDTMSKLSVVHLQAKFVETKAKPSPTGRSMNPLGSVTSLDEEHWPQGPLALSSIATLCILAPTSKRVCSLDL
jgi:hypothetical protein